MLRTRRDPTRAQAAAPPSRSNIAASRAAPRHRQARRAEHDPRQARALDADERRIVEQHPRHSEEILARVAAFAAIAEIAGAHHERLDGSGYPDGRTLEQLSLAMRILAVADVFEAMTAERPYRTAMTTEEALANAPKGGRDGEFFRVQEVLEER